MSSWLAFLMYAVALAAALTLVYLYHSRWYWHVLSVILAVGIGLYPAPENLRGPWLDAMIGSVFVFLLVWGAGEIVFHTVGHHRRMLHRT